MAEHRVAEVFEEGGGRACFGEEGDHVCIFLLLFLF